MRKILSLFAISLLVFFTACDMNTTPEFDDSDAFVAFDNAALSVAEDGETLQIPVTLASVKGVSASVNFEIVDGTAKLGENFTLVNESTSLTFDAENRTQYIEVSIIDNPGVFTGDLKFQVTLADDGKVKPSAESACTITIQDLDHPLSALLGIWNAKGNAGFSNDTSEKTWELEISKDDEDVSIVWFLPFSYNGAAKPVYGVVNDDLTEIKVPVQQITATSSTYPVIRIEGWYGEEGDDEIAAGGSITFTISEDMSTITCQDWYGVAAYNDEAASSLAGYYSLLQSGVTFTK